MIKKIGDRHRGACHLNKQKGFTLIEVLVAIVIVSSSIIAVFQIFSLGFRNFSKLHAYEDLYLALTNLTEEINAITDFETNREKKGTIGAFAYEWQAVPAQIPKKMTIPGEEYSPYDIIFYKVTLKVYLDPKSGTDNYREYTLYRTGWSNAQR